MFEKTVRCEIGHFIDMLGSLSEKTWDELEIAMFEAGLFPQQYTMHIDVDNLKVEPEWLKLLILKVMEFEGESEVELYQDI